MKTPQKRIEFFETVERGCALQAGITTLLTGLSGLYPVYKLNLWQRFLHIGYWWMHAMVLLWTLFTAMLVALEQLFLRRRLHRILLIVSLITIARSGAAGHGYLLFSR